MNQLQSKIKVDLGQRHEEEGRPHEIRDNYKRSRNLRIDSRTQRYHYLPIHSMKNLYSHTKS